MSTRQKCYIMANISGYRQGLNCSERHIQFLRKNSQLFGVGGGLITFLQCLSIDFIIDGFFTNLLSEQMLQTQVNARLIKSFSAPKAIADHYAAPYMFNALVTVVYMTMELMYLNLSIPCIQLSLGRSVTGWQSKFHGKKEA